MARPKENLEKRLSKISMDKDKIKKLYLAGWTDRQVADFLGITKMAIEKWKKLTEFSLPLKDWKKDADAKVEKSLYKRALGYAYRDRILEPEQTIVYKDGQRTSLTYNHDKMVVTKITKKQMPPDPTSMIFWLKNRQPDKWRDTKEVTVTDLTQEEIDARVERTRKALTI